MANIIFGLQNRADEATLAGGSWQSSLPLSNLKDRRFSRLARTANAAAGSTWFDVTFSRARSIGAVALVVHNLSASATVRVIGAADPSFSSPLYDSGNVQAWPSGMIPQNLLNWEDDNFWLGTLSQEAVAGYQSPYINLMPSSVVAQYWRIVVLDSSNPDGYLSIGRLYIGDTWQPTYNIAYGEALGFADSSTIEESLGGEEFFEQRKRRRIYTIQLPYVQASEGYVSALELDRLAGVSGEVLVIPDSSDVVNAPRRSFLGRLSNLSPLVRQQSDLFSKSYELSELL